MNETQIGKLMDIKRSQLAIQTAALEMRMDEKDSAAADRMINAVSGAITDAVVTLKAEIMLVRDELRDVRAELKMDLAELRTELKADIHRLEEKIDTHTHN